MSTLGIDHVIVPSSFSSSSIKALGDHQGDVLANNGIGIVGFFEDKNILVTGATGFLAKAYVNGEREGLIYEKPFTMGESITKEKVTSHSPSTKFPSLNAASELDFVSKLKNAIKNNGFEQIMKDLGDERAKLFGWQNTYSFTKAIGEMVIENMREDIPIVIVCPSTMTTSYQEPFPGWIQGFRVIDPTIIFYGKGEFPGILANPNLPIDVVPVDMVVNATMAAITKHGHLKIPELNVYHVASASVNPLLVSQFFDYCYEFFQSVPYVNSKGDQVMVKKMKYFDNISNFSNYIFEQLLKQHDEVRDLTEVEHSKMQMRFKRKLEYLENFSKMMNHMDSTMEGSYFGYSPHGFTKEQYSHLMSLFQQAQVSSLNHEHSNVGESSGSANFAGASNHMTPHKHLLHNLQPLSIPFLITLPNGYKGPSLKRPLEIGKALDGLYYCLTSHASDGTVSDDNSCSSLASFPNAMLQEFNALEANHTWDLVPLSSHKKPISCKWVHKIKHKSDGSVERYKARLIIRVYQLDFNNAFLHGDLHEEVYIKPPLGLTLSSSIPTSTPLVCKLRKSLYGLKQASRQWFSKISDALSRGYSSSKNDYSLLTKRVGHSLTVLTVYVDDILLARDDVFELDSLKLFLDTQFKIKDLGLVHYFLGLEISSTPQGYLMSQQKFAFDLLLDEFHCEQFSAISAPLNASLKLTTDMGAPLTHPCTYRRLVDQYITHGQVHSQDGMRDMRNKLIIEPGGYGHGHELKNSKYNDRYAHLKLTIPISFSRIQSVGNVLIPGTTTAGLPMHFLSKETWNIGWTEDRSEGNSIS
ncbi:hypothetical protein CQW23_21959 [Capsicum baccatum]|uniref:Fatty acyl-CoA reductase n=1 Tax=Capsicum baccatum TaxID=33114 RepID=A0A2G2VZH5_CAPBA|nr:hypothetical protein CQW23_21959 [Capsicum baccatum]